MKKTKIALVRALVSLTVFVLIVGGVILNAGVGTLSSFGIGSIASICPLGAFEALLGSWAFVPRLVFAVLAVCLVVFVVGKAFCSWVCPIPHMQAFLKTRKQKQRDREEREENAAFARENYQRGIERVEREKIDGRHIVLVGALGSAAIFGFPVFCLVCPVGLTFASFIALWQVLSANELTWGLVMFPAILILELLLLGKWCRRICPMGALMSLISQHGRTFRPTVDRAKCLRDSEGASCSECSKACPELIDPNRDVGRRSASECVRCMRCSSACPMQAISFPFRRNKQEKTPKS